MKKFISNVLIAVLLATSLLVVPINSKAEGNDDNIFADFNNATSADEVLTQADLGPDVTHSPMTLVTEGADSGKGMKVALDNDSQRYAQNFSVNDTSALINAFQHASNYSYLRLWINNPDSAEIGIRITLCSSDPADAAFLDPSGAILTQCDGTIIPTQTADHAGNGENHVVVPGGFAGWVALPLTSKLQPNYDISKTDYLVLDVRPRGGASSTAYILDEIGLTKEPAGQLHDNFFADFNNATSADEVLTQADLGPGVTHSPMTLVTEGADSGKGMKVALDNDSQCYAQNFSVNDTSALINAFQHASNYSYLRLWINNPDSAEIGIRITLCSSDPAGAAFLDPSGAILTQCDGTIIPTQTADHAGNGENHVVVPGGFAGWVALPLTSKLQPNYDISKTNYLVLDVRPRGGASSTAYILDEIGLTKDSAPSLELNKQMLEENINSYLAVTPDYKEYSSYNPTDCSQVKAITYDGASIDGQKTKVFAYIGFPETASATDKVPAVVLVHGGGGHAYADWVQTWVNRGYAAISMSNTGYFPNGEGEWVYGLSGDFDEDGYINAPNNDAMQYANGPIQKQWMYHAVVQTILANNILRSDSRVDSNKIGITGISWGGNITSIAMGYDSRYAFAVPVYGAGYLDQSLSYMNEFFSKPAVKALWSAADRFDKVKCPVLWLGWANDPNFSVQSNSLSYLATKNSNSILSIYQNWGHSDSQGWQPGEIYLFADSVVKEGKDLLSLDKLTGNTRNINFTFSNPDNNAEVTAKAYYLTEKMSYSKNGTLKDHYDCTTIDQKWKTVELTVNMDNSTVSGKLPSEAHSYYVEVTSIIDNVPTVVTTEYIELGKCGDVNSDACVDILDLVRLKKILSVSSEQNEVDCNADMNSDGKLDAEDLTELRKALLFAE